MEDIVGLAERAVVPDPEAALDAVTALRASLDHLEAQHVCRAVKNGCPWRRVGKLLGISKQAAHRRHGRRVIDVEVARRPELVVSGRMKYAIHLGRLEARERGARLAGTEDLLLGEIRRGGPLAAAGVESLGITLSTAREQVPQSLGAGADGALETDWRRVPLSDRAREAVEQSMRVAMSRGHRRLEAEHLMLALTRDGRAGAVRTLRGFGTSPGDVQQVLETALCSFGT
jgi:Clp amino terminal domain, pathogenicity island component